MKPLNNFLKCTIFLIFAGFVTTMQGETIPLSFDNPYPTTPYKQVLDTSMQIWGELDFLVQSHDQIDPENRALLIDALVGRFVYLDSYLNQMVNDQNIVIDDIAYLEHILTTIEQISKNLAQLHTDNHLIYIQQMAQAIQKKLSMLITE